MDWGQGSGKVVAVRAEHRRVIIITTVIISTLHGSAAWPSRGGDGDDRAGGAEGWGLGRAGQVEEKDLLPDWQKAWPPVLLALGSQWTGGGSVLPGERPWPLGATVAR